LNNLGDKNEAKGSIDGVDSNWRIRGDWERSV